MPAQPDFRTAHKLFQDGSKARFKGEPPTPPNGFTQKVASWWLAGWNAADSFIADLHASLRR